MDTHLSLDKATPPLAERCLKAHISVSQSEIRSHSTFECLLTGFEASSGRSQHERHRTPRGVLESPATPQWEPTEIVV